MAAAVGHRWCFNHHHLVREDFPPKSYAGGQTHDAQHGPDDCNSGFVVAHTHSLGKEDTAPAGCAGVALGSRVKKQRLQEAGFVVTRG